MTRCSILIALAVLAVSIASVRAGVPQPDVVLYGIVRIDGVIITASDNVTILGRVDGVANPVGVYHMGESFPAGNNYVLRIRLESAVAGSPVGNNAAQIGQTVHLFVKQAAGPEVPGPDFIITDRGVIENVPLLIGGACDTIRPSLVHANSGSPVTSPCSGYIDPRRESTNGTDLNAGISQVVLVFDEQVRDRNGSTLTSAAFSVRQTGGVAPPGVQGINAALNADRHVVTITLSRIITLQAWTTIEANVEDLCGNPINSFGVGPAGDRGPGMNEPDRVDIGFLPADVNQSSNVNPLDLVAFKNAINVGTIPAAACTTAIAAYADLDRNGLLNPIDLLTFKRLVNNLSPSTQSWSGKVMNAPRP